MSSLSALGAAAVVAFTLALPAHAATITIINNDGPGEGFNDPTPRDPVGGNNGTTVGAQRLNALQATANLLGSRIVSNVPILVSAQFNVLQCSPGNATIGAAGAQTLVADFPGAPFADTFYPVALANALSGQDQANGTDIGAEFNSGIDNNDLCLTGIDWYYGLDDNPPGNDLNFISTAAHELVHGLGFATFTNLATGQFSGGSPDVYARFILDRTFGPWTDLPPSQRAISAMNDGNLVWDGNNSQTAAATLSNGSNGNRVQLFAPAPLQQGSSVSHWDTDVTPNALMEPFETADVFITQGIGLATCLLEDIGWQLAGGISCPDGTPISGGGGTGGGTTDEGEPPPPDNTGGDDNGGVASSGGGGGGGGCVMTAEGNPDPLFPMMLLATLLFLARRRLAGTRS